MAVQAKDYRGKSAVPESFYQCRVSPEIRGVTKKHPVHYDSTLIFPLREMAEKYMPMFIRQLYELGILGEKQKYDTSIVQLATYLPSLEGQ